MRRPLAVAAVAVAVVAAAVAIALVVGSSADSGAMKGASRSASSRASGAGLARAVTVRGLVEHLRALEGIADRAGGTRAAGTPGDRASVSYVAGRLRVAGWRVRLQPVRFPYSAQRTPPELKAGGREIEATALRFSASGSVEAPLAPATSGCRAGDYASVPRGSVALVRRGGCFLRRIVRTAERAGAMAVIVYDPERVGPPLPGTLIAPGPRIPAVTIRREDGRRLEADLPPVRLRVDSVSEMRSTTNVIAELGSGAKVAMAGAHLDSVPEGPGVNDDGSGAATLLELAEQLGAERARYPRRLRFAFWGAEELGLYGSRFYVRSLPEARRRPIAGYLNLDMVGSGNGGRLIYGGDRGAAARAAAAVRRLYDSRGIRLEPADPGTSSDDAPFKSVGIPTVGLFSGASEIKGERQQDEWGGRAGKPYDSCYHLACDRLDRMDMRTLSELTDGAAVALDALARRD